MMPDLLLCPNCGVAQPRQPWLPHEDIETLRRLMNNLQTHADFVSNELGGGESGSECYGHDEAATLRAILAKIEEK